MIPPVVDLSWLEARADDVVLADVRWYLDGRSGREAYERGHLPLAVFVDLERWLAGASTPSRGRAPLPEPAIFAEGMALLGIGDDSTVVAYDDAGGTVAARLVWMLRATGHEAALLDGGIAAFDGALTCDADPVTPTHFSERPWPIERLAGIDDAADRANVVIDARSPERYRGDEEPMDPRAGHIPGALSVPCRNSLSPDGRFLPLDQLRSRFSAAGIGKDAPIVSYCGSGITACHNLLVLELAGFGTGRLFPGSWSQYSADPTRPVETGEGAPQVGQDRLTVEPRDQPDPRSAV